MSLSAVEQTALAALDEQGLISAFQQLLRIPSITGREATAQRWLGRHMQQLGLTVDLWTINVPELRQHPQFPGMEVDRSQHEALGLVGIWQRGNATKVAGSPSFVHGSGTPRGYHGVAEGSQDKPAKRLIFNGHIDVVPEGDHANWRHDPWGAERDGDYIYGRGACDMKGGLMAALYAIKAIHDSGVPLHGSLMLQSVVGEEDGGIGTFASLLRGHTGDAAIVCEPTHLNLIPAQAGALTFTVRVPGKAAHACVRLEGVSAIEKYLDIHRALMQLEKERNSGVQHPLLGKLRLPYPLSIGRVQAGNWSSSVAEELTFEGRIGVAMGEESRSVRHQLEQTLANLAEIDPWLRDHPLHIQWNGGQFDAGEIPMDSPLVALCRQCIVDLTQHEPAIEGAPYGSDLRLLVNMGKIPTLLFGPGDVKLGHVADENISVNEILLAARAYILAALRFLS